MHRELWGRPSSFILIECLSRDFLNSSKHKGWNEYRFAVHDINILTFSAIKFNNMNYHEPIILEVISFKKWSTDKPPNCITFHCNTSHCIKEHTLNCTIIKNSFFMRWLNHIKSYKTTYDICAKGTVYRKQLNIIILKFCRWLIIVHWLLIVHNRQNQSCTIRRFVYIFSRDWVEYWTCE